MSNADRCRRYRENRHARDMVRDMLRDMLPEIIQGVAKILRHGADMACRDTVPNGSSDKKSLPSGLPSKELTSSLTPMRADGFDRFWSIYPEKVGKGAARAAFPKALAKTSLDQLIAGVERYKATKPLDRPWCNPATWLNQERWTDVPAANGHASGYSNGLAIRTPSSKCSWPACSCAVRSACQAVNGELHV